MMTLFLSTSGAPYYVPPAVLGDPESIFKARESIRRDGHSSGRFYAWNTRASVQHGGNLWLCLPPTTRGSRKGADKSLARFRNYDPPYVLPFFCRKQMGTPTQIAEMSLTFFLFFFSLTFIVAIFFLTSVTFVMFTIIRDEAPPYTACQRVKCFIPTCVGKYRYLKVYCWGLCIFRALQYIEG